MAGEWTVRGRRGEHGTLIGYIVILGMGNMGTGGLDDDMVHGNWNHGNIKGDGDILE